MRNRRPRTGRDRRDLASVPQDPARRCYFSRAPFFGVFAPRFFALSNLAPRLLPLPPVFFSCSSAGQPTARFFVPRIMPPMLSSLNLLVGSHQRHSLRQSSRGDRTLRLAA